MTDRLVFPRLLAAAAAALLAGPAAWADATPADKGKRRLPRLFAEAVSLASKSTVRVLSDGKEVALGTVVAADGYVLTKGSELRGAIACVIQDGSDDMARYPATRVGYHRPTDLALLKIEAPGLKPVAFAEPKEAVVGNWVAAAGLGPDPLAVGVVSVGSRKLSPTSEDGHIVNANKGYLGIQLESVKGQDGAVVAIVQPRGAGAKAGLRADDLITEAADQPVKDADTLIKLLENYRPGDTVTLRLRRGDEEVNLRVKLGQKSDFDRGDFQNTMAGSLSGRRTGFPAVIQHDTVINPKDCGGPLVDLDGRVLGLNIARAGRVETWALPADVVKSALKELMPKPAKQSAAATK